ncbi:hypothetical protein VTJ83DRAFT_2217 [Remersonia thermophila]|uniref:Transmembrane protein n=1 Tax=Remersonia thermophila TaxID=72144 RepID=A0ABR4DI41_9PEZI
MSSRVTRSAAKRDYHPESSWRMVEGSENDSFDTSIVHDEEEFLVSTGSQPVGSQSFSAGDSQPFSIGGSQPWSIGGSQEDNLETFLSRAEEDERVLLRTPFRPSIPSSVRQSTRDELLQPRVPEPEFYMPKVDVESPRRPTTRSSAAAVARAWDPQPPPPSPPRLRHRQGRGSQGAGHADKGMPSPREEDVRSPIDRPMARATRSLIAVALDALRWAAGVVGLSLRYLQKPLAILLSLYIALGGVIVVQNMATRSITAAVSPICRIPGVSLLHLPFCPAPRPTRGGKGSDGAGRRAGELDNLMEVQDQLEQVLEKTAQGVSLPMEMKRSEASIRDLRTMVRYSNLRDREELVLEFDSFIGTAGAAADELQQFNTHVGSAVDWVISMNRWTSRHLDTLEAEAAGRGNGLVSAWTSWLLAPFQPATFSERHLLDRYIEHATLVSEKIAALILEAQEVLRTLARAESQLGVIHDLVTRTQKTVQSRKDEILWTLWTLIGANNRRLENLNSQLSLLRRVDAQRIHAVRQVSDLVVELQQIQAGLSDLRDRLAEPALVRDIVDVPLSVHIETIDRGVERLEAARKRIRAVENERIRAVLARGKGDERLLEQA